LCGLDSLPLQPGLPLSELHKLTTLTWLSVECSSDDVMLVAESVKGLAALTQLRNLLFRTDCAEFAKADLLPLTRLTTLRSLICSLESDSDDDHMGFSTLQVNTGWVAESWSCQRNSVLLGSSMPWRGKACLGNSSKCELCDGCKKHYM
jgi:hypothetical protein